MRNLKVLYSQLVFLSGLFALTLVVTNSVPSLHHHIPSDVFVESIQQDRPGLILLTETRFFRHQILSWEAPEINQCLIQIQHANLRQGPTLY